MKIERNKNKSTIKINRHCRNRTQIAKKRGSTVVISSLENIHIFFRKFLAIMKFAYYDDDKANLRLEI